MTNRSTVNALGLEPFEPDEPAPSSPNLFPVGYTARGCFPGNIALAKAVRTLRFETPHSQHTLGSDLQCRRERGPMLSLSLRFL